MAAPAAVAVGCCEKTNWLGAPARIVNASLSIEPNIELVAVIFFAPVKSMLKSLNAASPLVSVVLVVVPLRTPIPLLKLISNETPASGALLPNESFNCTVTGGAMATPAVVLVGCWLKANWLAAAGEIVKALLWAELSPELEAVSFFEPLKSMLKSAKVAKPPASVALVVVPLSAPKPVVKAIVMLIPALATLFPKASFNRAVTAGAMATPAVASVGCWAKATWLATAGAMVNALLATGVAGPLEAVKVFEPARLTLRLLKVATPLASVVCGFDPLSVPPPFNPSVTGTPGTLLVKLSATWTVTAGEIATPAVASLGCCVKTN